MKKINIILILLLITNIIFGQNNMRKFSLTADVGVNYFDGDVTPKSIEINSKTFKTIGSIPQLSYGGLVGYDMTDIYGLSIGCHYFPLKGENNYAYFYTKLIEYDINTNINFTKMVFPKSESKLTLNGSIGVGFSYYTFNSIIKDANKDKTIKNKSYYSTSINIPISFYLEYNLSNDISIGGKILYNSSNNDDLEGILIKKDNGFYDVTKGVSNDNIFAGMLYVKYNLTKTKKNMYCKSKIHTKDTLKNNITNNFYVNVNNFYYQINNYNNKIDTVKINKDIVGNDNIYSVYFDFNSYNLDINSKMIIKKISLIMKENENLRVEIRGYCDNLGNVEYNEELSINRTLSVKYELVNNCGINENRIITNGLGKIVSPNIKTKLNRRCDFLFF